MAKVDYIKAMKNLSLNRPQVEKVTQKRKNARTQRSLTIKIDANDQIRLNYFIKQELNFYNSLVSGLGSRVRAFPQDICDLTERYEKLFGELAANNTDVNKLRNSKKIESWAENLRPYYDLVIGSDKVKPLSERLAIIFELAASGGVIDPLMRKNIAIETLRFCKEQARIYKSELPQKNENSNLFKIAPTNLNTQDLINKRHVQLVKSLVEISYDEKTESSKIKNPYTMQPITVEGVDLTENKDWQIMILHQERGTIATSTTNWVVDFKEANSTYLLKYLDLVNAKKSSSLQQSMKHTSIRDEENIYKGNEKYKKLVIQQKLARK